MKFKIEKIDSRCSPEGGKWIAYPSEHEENVERVFFAYYLHSDGIIRESTYNGNTGKYSGWFRTRADVKKAVALYRDRELQNPLKSTMEKRFDEWWEEWKDSMGVNNKNIAWNSWKRSWRACQLNS